MADEEVKEITLEEPDVPEKTGESEKEHEPPPEHPRFKQVYGQMKQFERDLSFLKEELVKKESLIKEMASHNKNLSEAISKGFDSLVKGKEEETKESQTAKIEKQISELQEKRRAAVKDEDYDLINEIDGRIVDLKIDLREIKNKPVEKPPPPLPEINAEDIAVLKRFVSETEWWNEDPIMRASAIAIEKLLSTDPKWGNESLVERLKEVKRRVEERFNYGKKPPSMVDKGGESRSFVNIQNGKLQYKLTPEQKEFARITGCTEEEYAKQLYLIEKAKGERK
jgi:hypothetical protein